MKTLLMTLLMMITAQTVMAERLVDYSNHRTSVYKTVDAERPAGKCDYLGIASSNLECSQGARRNGYESFETTVARVKEANYRRGQSQKYEALACFGCL